MTTPTMRDPLEHADDCPWDCGVPDLTCTCHVAKVRAALDAPAPVQEPVTAEEIMSLTTRGSHSAAQVSVTRELACQIAALVAERTQRIMTALAGVPLPKDHHPIACPYGRTSHFNATIEEAPMMEGVEPVPVEPCDCWIGVVCDARGIPRPGSR